MMMTLSFIHIYTHLTYVMHMYSTEIYQSVCWSQAWLVVGARVALPGTDRPWHMTHGGAAKSVREM